MKEETSEKNSSKELENDYLSNEQTKELQDVLSKIKNAVVGICIIGILNPILRLLYFFLKNTSFNASDWMKYFLVVVGVISLIGLAFLFVVFVKHIRAVKRIIKKNTN